MNCEKIKEKVSIRLLLESFNLFPVKENQKTAFYFALDREEKIPSLSVDFVKNKAFDFGTGKSYDVISIVQIINKCSVSDALKYLSRFDYAMVNDKNVQDTGQEKNYHIIHVSDVKHPALIQYLKTRKVYEQRHLVKEINYELNDKKFFGIGFLNDSGGYEIRSKYAKICLGQKEVTWIKNELNPKNEVLIFEGFFDYLSYRNIDKAENSISDYLILNSTAMLFKVKDRLKDYHKVSLFLDNDSNGKATKEIIQNNYDNVEDCSLFYIGFNDLNEWFCNFNEKL
ncbi:DNA primase [Chryseobacterium carnipullorum]|uniref:DNA primase n=1 Tax=Chryseobacterium carnipullorum TaxID=1124835 RepID=A0A376DTF4_CHRCU|nr:toprim domain-containing protein [Chryseobacterium carnipullorum]AZA49511.1 DNA primase [Chryseobacterium carnipullorum]AZA64411.1 DNA primase [Chryseobacterium carnipullorum]STC94565.1 DNA primase [Chryseobacterium carnipullorum]